MPLHINNILEGWKNFLDKTEVVEEVAKRRAVVCAACPFAKKAMILTFIKDELTEIQGVKCQQCGCPLSAKIRSNDSCPINKW